METVKQFFAKLNPSVKLLLGVVVAYLGYKKIKKMVDLKNLNDRLKSSSGVGSDGTPLNLANVLEMLWYEYFETVTEDENKIVALINSIPVFRMREFALLYNAKVVNNKLSYNWWFGNWHAPKDFMEDTAYFLGARVKDVSVKLNAI